MGNKKAVSWQEDFFLAQKSSGSCWSKQKKEPPHQLFFAKKYGKQRHVDIIWHLSKKKKKKEEEKENAPYNVLERERSSFFFFLLHHHPLCHLFLRSPNCHKGWGRLHARTDTQSTNWDLLVGEAFFLTFFTYFPDLYVLLWNKYSRTPLIIVKNFTIW